MQKNTIADLQVGMTYKKSFCITEEMGKRFADISFDFNPIHLNQEFAETSRFGRKIVHGMYVGSYISGIIGNEFPGPGSIYLKQDLSFRRPVYYDTNIEICIEVKEIVSEKNRVVLRTYCVGEQDELLVDGNALIMLEN